MMLKDGGGQPPYAANYALLVVGKFGGPDDVDRLESQLMDQAICAQSRSPRPATPPANTDPTKPQPPSTRSFETQIRDVALAVMLHLSGQKLADYGFSRRSQIPRSFSTRLHWVSPAPHSGTRR